MAELIAVLALVVLALVFVGRAVRVIQQSTVGVVQRLGRYQRTIGRECTCSCRDSTGSA
jgi:regulator of protease activity HflC (stomatin/prohibitin superfamily)